MKNMYTRFLITILLATVMFGCPPPDPTSPPIRTAVKIALVDSLAVKNDDGKRMLPDNIRNIGAVLQSENKDCYRIYIPDPTLIRVDLVNGQLSLKTKVEKGGSKDVGNPKVIGKLIQKNFDELEVPKSFTKKRVTDANVGILLSDFVSSQVAKDSILVFDETGQSDSYVLNKKKYAVYSSTEDLRNRMLSILCENSKVNFTVLFNPPLVVSIPDTVSITGPVPLTRVITGGGGKTGERSGSRGTKRLGINRTINGDLSMIKGTEGCDVCTRYYSATDNLGRQHEVKEKNSTFCCPCGKTIEMKGRTYRMECNGAGGNKLAEITE